MTARAMLLHPAGVVTSLGVCLAGALFLPGPEPAHVALGGLFFATRAVGVGVWGCSGSSGCGAGRGAMRALGSAEGACRGDAEWRHRVAEPAAPVREIMTRCDKFSPQDTCTPAALAAVRCIGQPGPTSSVPSGPPRSPSSRLTSRSGP